MCAASQAGVLVPQGYGSILAQIIIIKKPQRSKGFIKQNMSWAFGSSCPRSAKHKFKCLEVGKLSAICQQLGDFREVARFAVVCPCVCAHVCTETAGTSPLSLSLCTSLILFQIHSPAELGVIQTVKRIRSKREQGESNLHIDPPLCPAVSQYSRNTAFQQLHGTLAQSLSLLCLEDKHSEAQNNKTAYA